MKVSIINGKVRGMIIFLFWMAMWQITFWMVGREIYFPSPQSVLAALTQMMTEVSFWISVWHSVGRVLFGVVLSISIGVGIGTICSFSPFAYDLMHPFVTMVRATPVISFIIIALVWLNSSWVPVFICVLMCFPIVWTAVVTGFRNVDAKLLEMASVYRVKPILICSGIYWPSMKPYLTSAVINALGLGWKVSVAAEVLSHPINSIGNNIYTAKAYLDSSGLFAWTVVVILLSYLFEVAFVRLVKGV